jgi:hypothetical protein
MSEAPTYEFGFMQELPKRQQAIRKSFWEIIGDLHKTFEEKGILVPVSLAAKCLGVSRTRIHQFISDGRLDIEVVDGHLFITENSLVKLAQTERKNGRPFQYPTGVKEVWNMAVDHAKETVKK